MDWLISFWLFSGAPEGGSAECSVSRQTEPDGEERVKSRAGQRERRQTDSPETTELWAADQRWDRLSSGTTLQCRFRVLLETIWHCEIEDHHVEFFQHQHLAENIFRPHITFFKERVCFSVDPEEAEEGEEGKEEAAGGTGLWVEKKAAGGESAQTLWPPRRWLEKILLLFSPPEFLQKVSEDVAVKV